jgi:oxygen-independent coproporphyrinogen-3 oxidase
VQQLPDVLARLKELETDGLIEIRANGVKVLPRGKPFLRNVGLCYDLRYHRAQPGKTIFSHTA